VYVFAKATAVQAGGPDHSRSRKHHAPRAAPIRPYAACSDRCWTCAQDVKSDAHPALIQGVYDAF
jgi:hypothetical protein